MPDNKLSNKIWNGNGIVNAIPFFVKENPQIVWGFKKGLPVSKK
jgi:hypothetical protein